MDKLQNVVQDINENILRKQYNETKEIIDEVAKFIIKKKLLLYGGFALNLLLPKKDKFYKEYTMNDFDCYSPNAKADAIELSKILSEKNYKYIKIKHALHENTFKIYVNFIQILDITQISKGLYNSFLRLAEAERKTPVYKYYNADFILTPIAFLKSNLHFELARPMSSYFRWEKIYRRSLLFDKIMKNVKLPKTSPKTPKDSNGSIDIDHYKQDIKDVLRYVKTNKLPIVSDYALKFYEIDESKYKKNRNNYLIILSTNIEKTKNEILQVLKSETTIKVSYVSPDIFPDYYTIQIDDSFNIIKVVSGNKECYSYIKKKGFVIGSYDTTLYFLYLEYLINMIDESYDEAKSVWKTIMCLEDFIANTFKQSPEKRLSVDCYGTYHSRRSVLAHKWKKKQTIKYY